MLTTKIEAILFATAKPIQIIQIQKQLGVSQEVLREVIDSIKDRFNVPESGINLLEHEGKIQLISNPDVGEDVAAFLKKEISGPLTRPSLETLAVIAYRGPVTKPEIEQVRGINCGLILRNLLIRGLIDEHEDSGRLQNIFTVSAEFLKELGLRNIKELPEYKSYNENEKIQHLMDEIQNNETVV